MKTQNLCIFLLFLTFASCRTFTHADGSKSRYLRVVKDDYKKVSKEDLNKHLHKFDLENVGKQLEISKPEDIYFEEINAANIQEIVKKNKATLMIQWYSNCGSVLPAIFEALKKAEKIKDPNFKILFVSTSYHIPMMQYQIFNLEYHTLSYLLPHKYGNTMIDKKINLGKELCPPCYEKYKDDLKNVYIYLVNQQQEIVSMHHTIYKKELKRSILSDIDQLNPRIEALLANE